MDKEAPPPTVTEARQLLAPGPLWPAGLIAASLLGAIGVSGMATDPLWMTPFLAIAAATAAYGAITSARAAPAVARAKTIVAEWDRLQVQRQLHAGAPKEPEDARWEAARALLDRVRQLDDQPRTREVADLLEQRLRALFSDLDGTAKAEQAESRLGTSGSDGRLNQLHNARALKEAALEQLLAGLGELHLELSLRDAETIDPAIRAVEDLLLQVGAEAEVEQDARTEAARRLRASQQTRE